jgi:hypothetical protein
MSTFEMIWLILAVAVTAVELYAIFFRASRDTLSGVLWKLSHKTWFRVLLFALDGWLLWHLLIQPYIATDTTRWAWLDITIAAACGLIGFSLDPPMWRKRTIHDLDKETDA